MNKSSLETLLSALAKELGLSEGVLATEKPGFYTLPLEEEVTITFSTISNGCLLKCVVAPYPVGAKQEAFTIQVMMGNLFGQATLGGVLGLTPDEKSVTLSRVIQAPFDYKEFRIIIEDFLNVVDFWRTNAIS